jgi:anaerobic magnesium-protoporphyrin IX monomethyl ester cyclase
VRAAAKGDFAVSHDQTETNKIVQISLPTTRKAAANGKLRRNAAATTRHKLEAVTLCSATMSEDGEVEPPLGPLYIAAAFEQVGVEVDFRDFQLQADAHGYSGEPLAEFLAGHREVVALSCFVDMLPAVIDATRRLHRVRPDTLFLLGGPGPTASARRILEEYPWIAGVVRGEGEETVMEWVRVMRGEATGPVAGMVYRRGGELVDGGNRARNRALDELPLPAYHLIDWSRYTNARVITTRGCSYKCSFCDVTALWGNRSVYRSLEATIDEMELLRDRYGKNVLAIVDDTFVLNRDRVRAFCKLLLERRSGIKWGCFGRINLMTPALVELMAEAGCDAVFYGIDSGSDAVLDRTVKRVRAADVMPVLRLSARHFDKIEASFIWGYPFETLADFKATLQLAAEAASLAPIVNVQLHMLSPLPLSPIYREFPDKLLLPEEADKRWLLLPALLLDERAALVRELVRAAPDIYPGFYTLPTPAKRAKRQLLERSMRALDRTIGRTLVEPKINRLIDEDDDATERRLYAEQRHPSDQIGVGLAIGFFRRLRRRGQFCSGEKPFEGTRGPRMVRERAEPAAISS